LRRWKEVSQLISMEKSVKPWIQQKSCYLERKVDEAIDEINCCFIHSLQILWVNCC
jgi:hypothetical protein